MEVTFKLEADDLWHYNLFVIRRVPSFLLVFAARILLMPLVVAAVYVHLFNDWLLGILVFTGAEAIWIPIMLWSSKRYNLKIINGRPGVFDLQTVSIASNGLRQKTSNADSLMSWQSFIEVVEYPRFLVFFMDKRYGIIIPKTAFRGVGEADLFFAASVAFWKGVPAPALSETSDVWPPPPQTLKP